MAEELAGSSYKYQCKATEKSGRVIKLSCEKPIHINSYCYDRVNRQHVLVVTVQYFDQADHNKEKAHIEYIFLDQNFQIVKALRENVPGGTPRLLIAPDGGIWVRIMSWDSDYTKDVVLPLQNRGRICREKKLPINVYSQEMLVGDGFVGFQHAMGRHSGKPDELVWWQFDKDGLFKKRTSIPIKFSVLGTLLVKPDGLSVFNLLTESDAARAKITRIDDRGRALEQWISRPFQGIRSMVPVSGYNYLNMHKHYVQSFQQINSADTVIDIRKEKQEFIGVSEQNSFVHLIFSREGELMDRIPILQLPEAVKVKKLDLVHRGALGWIGFSYMTEDLETGFVQWDGEKVVMEIMAGNDGQGKSGKCWTKVCGKEEMELAYQCMTHILQDEEDSFIMLSPFRPHYPAKKNEIVILRL